MNDFYKILEINENASQEEIKKSYRKLSLIHHPDKNNGNDEKFKKISEAYQVLSDIDERKKYDMGKHSPFGNNRNGPPGNEMNFPSGMDPGEIFKMFFNGNPGMPQMNGMSGFGGNPLGNVRMFRNGQPVNMNNLNKPPPIIKNIVISLEQAYKGDQVAVTIERWLFEDGIRKCENETLYIPIHKGIDDKEMIILREKGNVLDSSLKGDVKIIIIIQNTSQFKRDGLNLILEKEITLKESLCGFAFIIGHISGKQLRFNSEKGNTLKDGLVKIISNYGMERENHLGNLCIKFTVIYPETLTDEQVIKLSEIL